MESAFLQYIINAFSTNKEIFFSLLDKAGKDEYLWRQEPDKWCLLEIVCHLFDEEREDFRTRLKSVLNDPKDSFSPINPVGWVSERKYLEQHYSNKLNTFLDERDNSLKWLKSLSSPNWQNRYQHPQIGLMSAKMILSNWLAHDYLHIRQIIKIKFDYLKHQSGENLKYAGNW
jgi:hypothetical protein